MTLESVRFSPGAYLAPVIDWLNANFHAFFGAVTRIIEAVLSSIEWALLYLPGYAVILVVAAFAAIAVNIRVAVISGVALSFCLLSGLWEASMQTLALVTVAVCISVLIAFPVGILASRYRTLERFRFSSQYTTHLLLMGFGHASFQALTAFFGEKVIHALRASRPMRNHDFARRP